MESMVKLPKYEKALSFHYFVVVDQFLEGMKETES
jgi:hypothetical protein